MFTTKYTNQLSQILEDAAQTLDIPEHAFEDALLKFEDIKDHLIADDSNLRQYDIHIYPQGSFRLGTVVRPLGREGEYDIDLVCRLGIQKENTTQAELKQKVGARLKERADINEILTERRRCWMLDYPDAQDFPAFHLDVLPAIPNGTGNATAILLTDKELVRWQHSDPIEYANWFQERMAESLQLTRIALAEKKSVQVDMVEDYEVRTPLQRVVQILKRHRDVYFSTQDEIKPISIIITTLAAQAFRNEQTLAEALQGALERIPGLIERRDGEWWIQNPVNEAENFADKWNEDDNRRIAFFKWLEHLSSDVRQLLEGNSEVSASEFVTRSLGGATSVQRVVFGERTPSYLPATLTAAPLASTAHAIDPSTHFHMAIDPAARVTVSADVFLRRTSFKRLRALTKTANLAPGAWIRFRAKTNVSYAHIEWQVTNTGSVAANNNQLRGKFYQSDGASTFERWEHTDYYGTHIVEAFVIAPSGRCVARSGQILVPIRRR